MWLILNCVKKTSIKSKLILRINKLIIPKRAKNKSIRLNKELINIYISVIIIVNECI
jgi:hypothetical protein